MLKPRTSFVFGVLVLGLAPGLPTMLFGAWPEEQIADALRAAPPNVTSDARIYAFKANGERALVRNGTGPYTCVASGSNSLRVGKPPFPYPDPLCADTNAWAFFEAVWNESDPLRPSKALPSAPGMVWMLAGMNIDRGGIAYADKSRGTVMITEAGAGDDAARHIQMTPHLMILPLPVDASQADLPTTYDPSNPLLTWVMAAGTPLAHIHIHFSEDERAALSAIRPNR